jgi:serine/threonine protein kinase
MPIAPGTLIGQYRVVSLIGAGGMGAVYQAEHVVLGRPAAIKVLLPHIASDGGQVQRFINEARVAAQMNHRNVVDVLDCGMFPSPSAPDAQWYIALEYLHGVSLSKFIADSPKPIDLATIVHIVGEAANGLHAAHERHQLVHRDVKPDNLFLIETEDDPMRVKILDFGIAKLRQPGSGVQTWSHAVMGTPAYAAPEQLRESKHVDARADVWALGVVAHEMLTGVRPWESTLNVWEIVAHHAAMQAAPDPRRFRADIPEKVAGVISKAMEPELHRRWQSTRDFARALAEAAPMPFSGSGMAILERYAPELTRGSSHSLTAGRVLPAELRANPAEIPTGRGYAAVVQTISDGIPRSPSPGRSPIAGPSTITMSTTGAAAGQAIATPVRRVFASIAATGVIGLAISAAFMYSRGSGNDHREDSLRITAAIDAGSTAFIEAATAMSALAIVSDPVGAAISIDGISTGTAPLTVQLPVAANVEIRAMLPGRELVRRTVTVAATPATVRFELPQIIEAGATHPPAAPSTAPPSKRSRDSSHGDKKRPSGSAAGSGSDATFSPNDVM